MTSYNDLFDDGTEEDAEHVPSKTQRKRECHHLLDVGDEIVKLPADDLQSLDLPDQLREAIDTARKIKSNSGLKRQRQYIGKLLRSLDSEHIEQQLQRIKHRHDTNTAVFKRLERWRDQLLDNDTDTFAAVTDRYHDLDRQHLNQLIRQAAKERQQDKAPAASRKLFRYLRELEESLDS